MYRQFHVINKPIVQTKLPTEMSIEAFAMAGVDYMDGALEQKYKQMKQVTKTDRSLSVYVDEKRQNTSLSLDFGMDEWVKLKIREWATAVASNNDTRANRRASEILLIMDNHIVRGN